MVVVLLILVVVLSNITYSDDFVFLGILAVIVIAVIYFGLLLSLYYWRKSWAKNVFWMACVFMGAIQIYCPEGKLLGAGADAGRYVLELTHFLLTRQF